MNVSEDFIKESVKQLDSQRSGIILSLVICALGAAMGSMQILIMVRWKPLRQIDQILIFFIAATDVLKGVIFPLTSRRLYQLINGEPGLIIQRNCMYWLIPGSICVYMIQASMLSISVDRMISIKFRLWYSSEMIVFKKVIQTNIVIKISAILFSVSVGVTLSSTLLINSSNDEIQLICTSIASPSAISRALISYSEHVLCASALLVNCISCVVAIKRWQRASRSSVQEKINFRKDINLNALKALFMVITLFIITVYAGLVYSAILKALPISDSTRQMLAPYSNVFTHLRGALDVWIFILTCQGYRDGFAALFVKGAWKKQNKTSPIAAANIIHVDSTPLE